MTAPIDAHRKVLIAKIHIARSQLGLDEETYRDLVERVTGKTSTKNATTAALISLVDELKVKGFHDTPSFRPSKRADVRKIFAQWGELKRRGVLGTPTKSALRAFCANQTGAAKDPEHLTQAEARKVIEALKAWIERVGGNSWLAERGLVSLDQTGPVSVVRLTDRGAEVASGLSALRHRQSFEGHVPRTRAPRSAIARGVLVTKTDFHDVHPTQPVAPYVGGKRLLAKEIISRIEAIPHQCYAEPFVGLGGVFLRRPSAAKSEVINDFSRDVWGLFRVIQEHFAYFVDYLRFRLASRAEFERLLGIDPMTLTDIQRAARFLYLQRTAFGGKVHGRGFGVSPSTGSRFNVVKIVPMLEDLHERLAGVVIECLPYAEFIRRYDRPDTLFYLDPPYWACESYYGKGIFGRDDFERLAEILRELKGHFLMSLNDTPGVRETFAAFRIEAVETRYSVSARANRPAGEVIISR